MTDFLTWRALAWRIAVVCPISAVTTIAIVRTLRNPYFVEWWANHWPLAVVAIPLLVAYPIIFYELQHAWAKWTDGV